jgi:uncharacterized protein (DUF427 family)
METMKVAGPDHPIHLEAAARRVRARYKGRVIADSDGVLMLREAGYHPVAYFPRQDVSMEYLSRTDRRTHCPYKGHASYFSIMMDGELAENAAWTYETPYPAMELIGERIAFFPHPVEVYEPDERDTGVSTDAVVLHTDAGDGASQREHWPPNVEDPG